MSNFHDVELPSLEEALELTKKFKKPVGHTVLLIGTVAPMVTKGGVKISEGLQKQHQQHINNNGMLVVRSPFQDNEEVRPINAVFPGEVVVYGINTQAQLLTTVTSKNFVKGLSLPKGTIPTSEMYQKYVIMIVGSHDIVAVLNNE